MAAALLLAGPAAADDPCAEAAELREQIELLAAQTQFMIDDAKPVCAEKALTRECARRRVEIAGFLRQLKELNAQRHKAEAACAAIR